MIHPIYLLADEETRGTGRYAEVLARLKERHGPERVTDEQPALDEEQTLSGEARGEPFYVLAADDGTVGRETYERWQALNETGRPSFLAREAPDAWFNSSWEILRGEFPEIVELRAARERPEGVYPGGSSTRGSAERFVPIPAAVEVAPGVWLGNNAGGFGKSEAAYASLARYIQPNKGEE